MTKSMELIESIKDKMPLLLKNLNSTLEIFEQHPKLEACVILFTPSLFIINIQDYFTF